MVNEYDGKLAAEQKVWGKFGGGESVKRDDGEGGN